LEKDQDREAAAGQAAQAARAAEEAEGTVQAEAEAAWAAPVQVPAPEETACARTAGRRLPIHPACPVTR